MRKLAFAGSLVAVALLSTGAFAQSQSPAPAQPAAKADTAPKLSAPHWRSSKMIGLNVYNEQNDKLGDINEIIFDKDGKTLGYVVGVGGFLGMGEHDILVEPNKIKFVNEPRRTQTSANNPPPANAPANTRTDTTASSPRAATEQWYPDHAVLSATKDQLKAIPQFKYSNYN